MKRTRRPWRLPARRRAQVVEQPQCRAEPGECGVRSRQQQGVGIILQCRDLAQQNGERIGCGIAHIARGHRIALVVKYQDSNAVTLIGMATFDDHVRVLLWGRDPGRSAIFVPGPGDAGIVSGSPSVGTL